MGMHHLSLATEITEITENGNPKKSEVREPEVRGQLPRLWGSGF